MISFCHVNFGYTEFKLIKLKQENMACFSFRNPSSISLLRSMESCLQPLTLLLWLRVAQVSLPPLLGHWRAIAAVELDELHLVCCGGDDVAAAAQDMSFFFELAHI